MAFMQLLLIINNKKYYGVANIGYKPTFDGKSIFLKLIYLIFLIIYMARD
jgi:FAD synthase